MPLLLPNTFGNRKILLLPAISRDLPGNLKLPGGITLESLYQINGQSIWYLIWILKKNRFWPDLTRAVLEKPFIVKRLYWTNGQMYKIYTMKNNRLHSIYCDWHENGQLWEKSHWKDGKRHGISCEWHKDGQLKRQKHYADGIKLH